MPALLIEARASPLSLRFTLTSPKLPRRVSAVAPPVETPKPGQSDVKVQWIRQQLAEEQLESTLQHRLIVGASFGLNLWVLFRSLFELSNWTEAVGAVSLVYVAYLTADLLSGIYHWSIDNYGSERTPVIGNQIEGFQRHHRYPWTITHRQFCNNVAPVCLPAIPFSVGLLVMHPGQLLEIWASVGCMLVVLSQQCHAWAHTKKKDLLQWVQLLQSQGVLISTKMHCQHHRSPFAINYCIVSGAWNPFLDRFGIFGHLEDFIFAQTGVEPRSWRDASTQDVVPYFDDAASRDG